MAKLFILSLLTLGIALYLQTRRSARRIRNERDAVQGRADRRLVLLRSDADRAPARAAHHGETQTP